MSAARSVGIRGDLRTEECGLASASSVQTRALDWFDSTASALLARGPPVIFSMRRESHRRATRGPNRGKAASIKRAKKGPVPSGPFLLVEATDACVSPVRSDDGLHAIRRRRPHAHLPERVVAGHARYHVVVAR